MRLEIPEFLMKMLIEQYEEKDIEKIIQGYQLKRKTTFRINTLKNTVEEIISQLEEKKIAYKKVDWSAEAIILEDISEKEIKKLDIYQEGKIYLQSLSSMLPPIILDPKEGTDLLDMAAAPGGKTTQLAAITHNKANITAYEKNKIRAERLKYNIEKQGAKVYVIREDSRKIDDFFSFDQILLDSPCTGSGTIYLQDNKWKETFNQKLLNNCIETQIALLRKSICLLKPKKDMIYSTCSIFASENEEQIQKIVKEKKVEIVPIHFKGIENLPLLPTKIEGTLCVCPNECYEGFFIAKIRKI